MTQMENTIAKDRARMLPALIKRSAELAVQRRRSRADRDDSLGAVRLIVLRPAHPEGVRSLL
jgi:hypothetical protein